MSGWGLGWFGGGAAKKKDAPKNAILQLRSTLEMLTKREKHLQNQMDEQDTIARKHVTSNKAGMCSSPRHVEVQDARLVWNQRTLRRPISNREANVVSI